MIITLHRAIVALPSVDGGRGRLALVLADPLATVVVLLLVDARGQVGVVGLVDVTAVLAPRGLDGSLVAGDEVPQDLLGDEQAVLELGERVAGRLEQDDVVRALAVPVDRVREPTAAPRGDLGDLPAAAVIWRVVRSMTAWLRSSGTSGRSTSMSS